LNRFEQQIYDCMKPTRRLLEQTTKPLHRAILLNFWRHVHLEAAGEYGKILASDMTVDNPVYRVTWGANPAVIEGKQGVLAFYNSVGESVLWHSDDRLAVADWGVSDEITFHQLAAGSDLQAIGQAASAYLATKHTARERALPKSRAAIRLCAGRQASLRALGLSARDRQFPHSPGWAKSWPRPPGQSPARTSPARGEG